MIDADAVATYAAHSAPAFEVTASADGKFFASHGLDNQTCLWQTGNLKPLATYPYQEKFTLATESARAVRISAAGAIHLLSLPDLQEIRQLVGHAGTTSAVALSPDGQRLLSGGSDGSLVYWDLASGREIYRHTFDTGVTGVDLSPLGDAGLCGLESELVECDLRERRVRRTYDVNEWEEILGVMYSPGGTYACHDGATGAGAIDLLTDRGINLPPAGAELGAPRHGPKPNRCFSPGDSQLVSGAFGGVVHLWKTRPLYPERQFELGGNWVYCLRFSPDGRHCLCGNDVCLQLLEPTTGEVIWRSVVTPTHASWVAPLGAHQWLSAHGGYLLNDTGSAEKVKGQYVTHDNVVRQWSVA